MVLDPLDAPATPDRLGRLVEAAVLEGEQIGRAYAAASATPSRADWARLADRALLILGAMLTVAGTIFFFAFNWAKIPAFAKFAMIGAAIAGAVVIAQRQTLDRPAGKMSLVVAALLIGPLLAVFGQHYQTGADPYELFLAWVLLAIPWAIAARSSILWGLCIALADLTAILFVEQVLDYRESSWGWGAWLPIAAAIHLVAIVVLELLRDAPTKADRAHRLLARILALGGVAALTVGAAAWVVKEDTSKDGAIAVCAACTPVAWASMLGLYRSARKDLPMLAIVGGSVVVVVTTVAGRTLDNAGWRSAGLVLMLGLFLVGEVAVLASWLRHEAGHPRAAVASGGES